MVLTNPSTLPIKDIIIEKRLRNMDIDKVRELAKSIQDISLINPVQIKKNGNSSYKLVAGLHRIEAFKLLQRNSIPSIIYDSNNILTDELIEIDENLIRNELNALESGELLLRRDELLSQLGLRAKAGDNQYNGSEMISPPKTTVEIAKEAGMSERTSQQRKQVAKNLSPDVKEILKNKPITNSITALLELSRLSPEQQLKVVKRIGNNGTDIKRVIKETLREEKLQELEKKSNGFSNDSVKLICGDFREVCKDIPANSVDVIVTDAPYAKEYLDLFEDLAILGKRVLKDGGSMLVMVGQYFLPDILNSMCKHLNYYWTHVNYYWTHAYLMPGGQSARLWQKRVNTFWKPVLWFVKGEYNGDSVGDVAKSANNNNDKRFHKWGQSESGMTDLIERFSHPGEVILDPFLGGGTTGVVALKMKRKFIGIDIEERNINITKGRMQELMDK